MNRLWVVAYDITNDRNRSSVRRILANHGNRVQYSIFECWIDDRVMANLRIRVARFLEVQDSVRWYPLCRWCRETVDWYGNGQAAEDQPFYLL